MEYITPPSLGLLDSRYLRLNCSNDPLTDDLEISHTGASYLQVTSTDHLIAGISLQRGTGWMTDIYTDYRLYDNSAGDLLLDSYILVVATPTQTNVFTYTQSTNAFCFNTNVGIGTYSPDSVLHIAVNNATAVFRMERNDVTIGTDDIVARIEAEGKDTDAPGVCAKLEAIGEGTTGETGWRFSTGVAGATAETMRLDYLGNLGLGVTEPDARLHVEYVTGATFRLTRKDTAPTDDAIIGRIEFENQDTSSHGIAAYIQAESEGSVGETGLVFATGTAGTIAERMRIDSSGNVGIGTTAPGEKLEVTGNFQLTTDGNLIKLGTGEDMTIQYTGTVGRIDTSIVAPSDLQIDCGADKTLVLDVPVYQDINMAGYLLAKPAASAPGVDTFRSTGGTDTTIETYAFAEDERVHGGFELQHDYKEGTDLIFHVHWQGIAAPTGTDNVQWRLNYIVSRDGVTLAAATVFDSPDTAIDTQYRTYRTDFAAITGTTFKIGGQFMFTLTRVAATGDAYAGDALIETAGIHYQIDTLGSRTITIK